MNPSPNPIPTDSQKAHETTGRKPEESNFLEEALFYKLSEKAERVRWRMQDISWNRLDKTFVVPELLGLVRDIASSELTTFTASQRFLKDFGGDPDFTQWISVWFYEETRHSQILLKWLSHFGVVVDSSFLLKGRGTTAFMNSRIGTLVTNIISEMVASSNYRNLSLACKEPVLAQIAWNISQDEARHASGFYSYARKMLAQSKTPESDRRDALKILYMWFQENERVQHPVNEFQGRQKSLPTENIFSNRTWQDYSEIRLRACKKIGNLIGSPIETPEDVLQYLRA